MYHTKSNLDFVAFAFVLISDFFITFKRFQRPIRSLMRQLATHTDKITFVNLARTE